MACAECRMGLLYWGRYCRGRDLESDATPSTTDDLAARLPFCPRCRYSLRGLPGAGRCPECGLAYDDESRMSVAPKGRAYRWQTRWLLISAVISIIASLLMAASAALNSGGSNRGLFKFSVVYVGLGIFGFWRWHRFRYGPPMFLGLMPDGLWYCDVLNRNRFLPWWRIDSALDQSAGRPGYFRIRLHPKGSIVVSHVLTTAERMRLAAECIAMHVNRVQPAAKDRQA